MSNAGDNLKISIYLPVDNSIRETMVGQYEELSCPFCDKGRIPCLYIGGSYSYKKTMAAHTSKSVPVKSSDVWIIKSGCSVCGKSVEEVEKELRRKDII